MHTRTQTRWGLVALSATLACIVAAIALAFPVSTGAYLYWYNWKGVTRTNLNGSGLDRHFIQTENTFDGGLAVNGRFIFMGGQVGIVGRAKLDGGGLNPDFFTIPQPLAPEDNGEEDADSLVVEGPHIYWSGYKQYISRASVNGGEIEQNFIHTESNVITIAVDASHIYWITAHDIGRANLDGGEIEPDFIKLPGTAHPHEADGLAVAGNCIYWTLHWSGSIGRARIDGSEIDPNFIADLGYPGLGYLYEPTVAGGYIFWLVRETLHVPSFVWIGRARIDGSGVEPDLINVEYQIAGGLGADSLGPGKTISRHPKRNRHLHRLTELKAKSTGHNLPSLTW